MRRFARLLVCALAAAFAGLPAAEPPGPNAGEKLPPVAAVDQDGKPRTFESIRGPKGAMIVFYRSADW